MRSFLLVFVLLAIVDRYLCEKDVFEDLYSCHVGPTFNDCLTISFNNIFPQLKDGRAEYDIPALEPLHIAHVEYGKKSTGAVQVSQEYKNLSISNFALKTKFTKVIADLEKNTLTVELSNPSIRIKGDFELHGQILVLPINSEGKFDLKVTDVVAKAVLKYKTIHRNGKTYWQFFRIDTFITLNGFDFHGENLISGQKELTDQLNKIFNENWRALWSEIKPEYEEVIGKTVLNIVNKAFINIPLDKTIGGKK